MSRKTLILGWRLGCLFEHEASLEVGIGMHNGVEVCLTPCAILLDLLDLVAMGPFEHPVTCDVESILLNIFPNTT